MKAFERRYVRMEEVRELDVRNGRPVSRWVTVGYKHMGRVQGEVRDPSTSGGPTTTWNPTCRFRRWPLRPRSGSTSTRAQRERYEEVQKGRGQAPP